MGAHHNTGKAGSLQYGEKVECVCGQTVRVQVEDDSNNSMTFNGIISEVQYHVDIDTGEGVAGGEEEAQATEAQATEAQADTKAETEATNPV